MDLGEHRLKDLSQPEHLFQLNIEDLRTDFPPVNSLDAARVRLPEFLTEFVGREAELRAVIAEAANERLVTLIGIGGSGKTRLAVEAGRAIAALNRSGVFFVGLVDAIDGVTIAKAAADELSLAEQAGRPIDSTLVDHLRSRSDLLIFDNCEHLAEAAADLIERLLRACPDLSVIATSREALLLDGERLVQVGPLQLPDANKPEETLASDAVQLFIARAQQVNPRFDPEPWIEDLDRSRSRSGERRHETLETAMDWSYDLLPEELQRLLRRLSVFRGGFTFGAVQDVCYQPDADPMMVLDNLTALSERSLLLREVGISETRFRLLETIREYAARRLDQSDDSEGSESRHRDYYESFARTQTLRLGGRGQLEALNLLEADHDNLIAVLRRASDRDVDGAAGLAGRLTWFWYLHAHYTEGEHWANRLLQSLPPDPDLPWLRLLIGSAQYDYRIGEYDRASNKLHAALGHADRIGSRRMKMWSHAYLATNEMYRMNADAALEQATTAIEIAQGEDDLMALGYATYLHVTVETWLLLSAGRLTSDKAAALRARLAPVSSGVRSAGERNMMGHVLQSEAILAARSGDTHRATAAFDDSIAALTELGTVGCVCHCLEAIAEYSSAAGLYSRAVTLIGASNGLRDSVGIRGRRRERSRPCRSLASRSSDPDRDPPGSRVKWTGRRDAPMSKAQLAGKRVPVSFEDNSQPTADNQVWSAWAATSKMVSVGSAPADRNIRTPPGVSTEAR
jgi:predicted ATPase